MAGRGRIPTPTQILRLRASSAIRKRRKDEPEPVSGLPTPPKWFDREHKAEWRKLVADLADAQVLSRADWRSMVQAVTLYVRYARYVRDGDKDCARTLCELAGMLHRVLCEFGLTPASRTRVKAEPKRSDPSGKAHFFEPVSKDAT